MPTSPVKLDVRPPASLFLNGAVKRKSEDVADESSWERELSREVCPADGAKRRCHWSTTQSFAGFFPEPVFINPNVQVSPVSSRPQLPAVQPPEDTTYVGSDENFNGGVESLETDMEVDTAAEANANPTASLESQKADVACSTDYTCVERGYRTSPSPRCYCRLSWDPMSDIAPYISDIY